MGIVVTFCGLFVDLSKYCGVVAFLFCTCYTTCWSVCRNKATTSSARPDAVDCHRLSICAVQQMEVIEFQSILL